MRAILLIAVVGMMIMSARAESQGTPRRADVLVYGGNAAGVVAAVSAAREGRSVILLEPGKHLGGLMSGGLGATDFGRKECIGGMSREFFVRAGKHYSEEVSWYFEPHVAEQIFEEMLNETSVTVLRQNRLREKTGVEKEAGKILSITMENGNEFVAGVYIDCSYEGDLMAQAGVKYTWGREGTSEYGESLAGVRDKTPKHQFTVSVDARTSDGKLLPEISPEPKAPAGSADKKVQAYNFRLCMTQRPDIMTSFPKPKNYDPERYELLARMIATMDAKNTTPTSVHNLMHPLMLVKGKTDTNNNGAFSTDYIGANYDYPDGDYATRARIWQAHEDYVKGFLYFLANDPKVPERLRAEMNTWGLAKDEFVDNGNWPHQLYVREARRMIGEHVMSQKDIQIDRTKPDPIGMGSYNSDSHNVQRIVNEQGFAENEGDMQVPVKPYQIPYRSLLPKRDQCTNLLVPVCCSATHVAYSTVRMEPQFMIAGEAAGLAASMATTAKNGVHDVDTSALVKRLRERKAVLEWTPSAKPAAKPGPKRTQP